jgi:phospholipase C
MLLVVAGVALLAWTGCAGIGGPASAGSSTGSSGGAASADISAVNHVLIMFQENRSFDSYFWNMTTYRNSQNIPINSSDGKIRDGSDPNNTNLAANGIAPYHTGSQCTEDLTPDWAEAHHEMDLYNPASAGPGAPMNGFVATALGLSQFLGVLVDNTGHRAMGYFTDQELNYYYFMASNFAMNDMLFSPVPSRTSANRLYIHAATSQGHVHPDTTVNTQLTAKTIWSALDAAGVSWKIYLSDWDPTNPSAASSCPSGDTSGRCFSYFDFFTDSNSRQAHIVSIQQYFSDAQNGTLPSVAFIEAGMQTGRDEHPTNNQGPDIAVPSNVAIRVQSGAAWVSKVVNALMSSPSWKDSVFFFTYDEGGGAFDHVPPVSVPNPDGIKPVDLEAGKDCFNLPCNTPSLDFTITGFRVPNFIASPFARKNYVSHTPMDYTAFLAFIEKRWNVAPLTQRDAHWLNSGVDMTEFFDFSGAPWATPPTPPTQREDAACNYAAE